VSALKDDTNTFVTVSALKDDTNTFVTGFTYDNNNTFTINDNTGSAFTATINQVSGLTVNGTLSATTLDGNTILSGGTNLITIIDDRDNIIDDRDNYVTGTTFGSNQSVTTTRDGIDVLKISGGTNVTLSNPSGNQIKIDVTIPPDDNTFITAFTYDDINTFTITDNLGTAFTSSINVLSATTISGGTLYGDGSNLTGIPHTTDTFVTGGTYNDSTDIITFTNTTGGTFNVTGITDTFVTGFTWNPSTFDLTIEQNNGITDETVNLSILASDVYVLSGVYSASTGIVTYTNSTGGTFQVSGFTTGMTDSYTVSANLNSESIEFVNNIQTPSPFYSVSLTPLLSGKTDVTLFNSYTSDTQTVFDSKISGATNLSTTGLFAQKNGENLEFKGITSTGGTVTITNDSTRVNLDVTIPPDTNTFVTGGTYNDSTDIITFTNTTGGTFNVTGITDTFVHIMILQILLHLQIPLVVLLM